MAERFRVIWAPAARLDLEDVLEWVENLSAPNAAKLLRRIESAVVALKRFPRRGRIVPELRPLGILSFRELIVGLNRVVYRVEGREVRVVAVIDGRRELEDLLIGRALRDIEPGS